MPAGRPTIYSEAMVEEICQRLERAESLRSICRDDHMPERGTFNRWLDEKPDLATKYARSKEIGLDEAAEKLAEEMDAEEDVSRAKLKFEYRRWYLSKLYPKRYGDKVQHADAEGNVLPVPSFVVTPVLPLPKPSDE